jgi:hypothetical protein
LQQLKGKEAAVKLFFAYKDTEEKFSEEELDEVAVWWNGYSKQRLRRMDNKTSSSKKTPGGSRGKKHSDTKLSPNTRKELADHYDKALSANMSIAENATKATDACFSTYAKALTASKSRRSRVSDSSSESEASVASGKEATEAPTGRAYLFYFPLLYSPVDRSICIQLMSTIA